MKLSDISAAIKGSLRAATDPSVTQLSTPEDAEAGSLVLCLVEKWVQKTLDAMPAGVVTSSSLAPHFLGVLPTIIIDNEAEALTNLLRVFAIAPRPTEHRIHPSAEIAVTASLHETAVIGPHCTIGYDSVIGESVRLYPGVVVGNDVRIGRQSIVLPNAVVMDGVRIGSHTVIGPGAIIGHEGFSVHNHELRPHIGSVTVGDHSSIGANSCVDRGTIGTTHVGAYTHADNLVQIGHNVRIADHVIICGQVGLSGSVTINDGVVIGGQAGVTHGVEVAKGVMIAAQSGVTKNLETPGRYSGHPAEPNQTRLRRLANLKRMVEDETS